VDTAYTPYNAVNMGPHQRPHWPVARGHVQHGLRFGSDHHSNRTLSWMQLSHGSDTKGHCRACPTMVAIPAIRISTWLVYFDHNLADTVNPPVIWREYWRLRIQ